jgi:hypothetical protein
MPVPEPVAQDGVPVRQPVISRNGWVTTRICSVETLGYCRASLRRDGRSDKERYLFEPLFCYGD